MATDLSIPNSIIQAFIAGSNARREREALSYQKEQDKAQLEQRKKEQESQLNLAQQQLDEQSRQFEARQNVERANNELLMLTARQKLKQDITESGIMPEDSTITKPEFFSSGEFGMQPIARDLSGIPQGYLDIEHPLLGKFRLPSHETYIKQKAQDIDILEGPKRKTQQDLQEAETQRQLAVEKLKSINDAAMKREEMASREDIANKDRESRERIAAAADSTRLAAAKLRGTSDKTSTAAQKIVDKFRTSKVYTDFNIIRAQKAFADQVDINGATGTDDTALINAYVKANDPNRVTESEFDIAARSGQSLATQFKFKANNILSHTQFLSPEARQYMKDTIDKRYKAHERVAEAVKKETFNEFKQIGEDPNNWLPDFTKSNENKPSLEDIFK